MAGAFPTARGADDDGVLDLFAGFIDEDAAEAGVVGPLLAGIVGFRLEVTRLEAKWKLNQNHPRARRDRVIRALEAEGEPRLIHTVRGVGYVLKEG